MCASDRLKILSTLNADNANHGAFDFAYIDADKTSYPDYCEKLLPLLKSNGFIMIDNVLWSGKVADAAMRESDECTAALHRCVRNMIDDERVEVVSMMLADGVTVVRKK